MIWKRSPLSELTKSYLVSSCVYRSRGIAYPSLNLKRRKSQRRASEGQDRREQLRVRLHQMLVRARSAIHATRTIMVLGSINEGTAPGAGSIEVTNVKHQRA